MGQVSWEKRAYLLDGENIFFASMPEEWKTYISNEVVQIHCPDRGVKDSDVQEYFYMYVGKVYEKKTKQRKDFILFYYQSHTILFSFCRAIPFHRYCPV